MQVAALAARHELEHGQHVVRVDLQDLRDLEPPAGRVQVGQALDVALAALDAHGQQARRRVLTGPAQPLVR